MTEENRSAITQMLCLLAVAVMFLMFGWMLGREHQCTTMGAEYTKGKCVVVTRTEVVT